MRRDRPCEAAGGHQARSDGRLPRNARRALDRALRALASAHDAYGVHIAEVQVGGTVYGVSIAQEPGGDCPTCQALDADRDMLEALDATLH